MASQSRRMRFEPLKMIQSRKTTIQALV